MTLQFNVMQILLPKNDEFHYFIRQTLNEAQRKWKEKKYILNQANLFYEHAANNRYKRIKFGLALKSQIQIQIQKYHGYNFKYIL